MSEATPDWRGDLIRSLVANRLALRHDAAPAPAPGASAFSEPADLGYVAFGPIVFDFVAWLSRQVPSGRSIAFPGLEGKVLRRAWDRLAAAIGRAGSVEAAADAVAGLSVSALGAARTGHALWAPSGDRVAGRHPVDAGTHAGRLAFFCGPAAPVGANGEFVGSVESVQSGMLEFVADMVGYFGRDAGRLDLGAGLVRARLDLAASWPPPLVRVLGGHSAGLPRATATRTAILVLGMHRSGTSALTRVIDLLGVDNARDLLGPWHSNPTGHWEPVRLQQFHDAVLETAGSSWNDWRKLRLDGQDLAGLRRDLFRIVEDQYGASPLFVVKDPRICRLVPLWLDMCAGNAIRPVAIIPIRGPFEVAASLEARDGLGRPASLLLWLRHVLDAEFHSRAIPRAIVSYGDLLEDWPATVAAIAARTGIGWPRPIEAARAEIDGFLDPTLHHHAAPDPEIAGAIAEAADEAYRALRALGRHPDDRDALARLDALRHRLDQDQGDGTLPGREPVANAAPPPP